MRSDDEIFRIACFSIYLLSQADSGEIISDSYEINRVDLAPFDDAILYNDIAEILNDFESNVYPPYPSISESEENIEDLLSEYQHYLEKAHMQKKNYEQKSKNKNKTPFLRREKYSKMKPFTENKFVNYFEAFPNTLKYVDRPVSNQLDLLVPYQSDSKFYAREVNTMPRTNNREAKTKTVTGENSLINLSPLLPTSNYEAVKSSCFCEDNEIPCKCNCKQCLIPFDMNDDFNKKLKGDLNENKNVPEPALPLLSNDIMFENSEFSGQPSDTSDNELKIRVKVDIKLPKILEKILRSNNDSQDNILETGGKPTKETKFLKSLPISKFNLPIPIEFFGLRKPIRINKHGSGDFHKITIHKKKKTKYPVNGNKKHKKRIITFHNIKFEPQVIPLFKVDENFTESIVNQSIENTDIKFPPKEIFNNSENINEKNFNQNTIITRAALANTTDFNSIHIVLSPSGNSSIDKNIDDSNKTENSIEIDYFKTHINVSTESPKTLRRKRSLASSQSLTWKETHELKPISTNNEAEPMKNIKDKNKLLSIDNELLYWPNNDNNYSRTHSKNITEIILERENSKVKVNLSQETIRMNHTLALEHAIFGNVDWNDVGTVAPVFMSFMGKYIRGILTFCSQTICHSMKCFDKICTHRVCQPEERFNQRGHCAGSDQTDSVATMESIMDLPSNIAFEIVDILHNKMLGKIYGKVTLCISSKCVSLVASKKTFLKSKCSIKDLSPTGHCSDLKHSKVM